MSINKDEALRAIDIAESLMKKADFSGARRLVLRSQKLDSSLENTPHMMMVCDVHCAAAETLVGDEMDWYGILQVQQKADNLTIKKQFKKLALLLHPDKNKLPGAEAAFKLIGEAQRVLLDKDKRSLHDMKRSNVSRPVPAPSHCPQQPPSYCTQPVFQTNHNAKNNFTGFRPENRQQQQKAKAQAQPAGFCGSTSFWTSCPFCHMRYEYERVHINKLINCQSCTRQFTTFEVPCHGAPRAKRSVQTTFSFPQQKHVPTQGACKESSPVPGCSAKGKDQTISGFPQQQNVPNQHPLNVEQKNPQTSSSYYSVKDGIPVTGRTVKAGSKNTSGNRKRKKIISVSSDSGSGAESEEGITISKNGGDPIAGQGSGSVSEQQLRRSVRSKLKVSYNETSNDDDGNFVYLNQGGSKGNGDVEGAEESGTRKQSRENDFSIRTLPNGKNKSKKSKGKENGQVGVSMENSGDSEVKINSSSCYPKKDSSSGGEPIVMQYADPDFNDFDEMREEHKFEAGQIWAVYDTHDGMPRFYAYIRKVFTHVFKLEITWLEAEPDDDNGISWYKADLPIAVGKFLFGITETTVDRPMFSHVIHHVEGNKKLCLVFPRKGETWALFKNWDIEWSTDPDSHREYQYEFAVVLSEYSEAAGVSVALLYKVKGFSSVFCRISKGGEFQIPPLELYRFSHSVPSCRLTGKERGVPEGSYELDPAALPHNIEEVSVSFPPNISAPPVESKPTSMDQSSRSLASISDRKVVPQPHFKNFDADRSKTKFQCGQIWALYGKEDDLPKYYAKIKKVEWKPKFKLQISWLEPKSFPVNVMKWHDGNMPICCGTFSLKKGSFDTHTDVSAFSHQMEFESSRNKTEFTILPKNGEIWAMYKNWSDRIKVSDLKKWEYNIVEVLDVNETNIEVMMLERVNGFDTVVKEAEKRGSQVIKTFPVSELLRFSHRVPFFRLTGERRGTLRNFIELDPKALFRNFFSDVKFHL